MRTEEEATELVNELRRLNVVRWYEAKRRDCLMGFREYAYLSCYLDEYYFDIASEVEGLLEGKKTIELYKDRKDYNWKIRIFYRDPKEEQRVKAALKKLLDREE